MSSNQVQAGQLVGTCYYTLLYTELHVYMYTMCIHMYHSMYPSPLCSDCVCRSPINAQRCSMLLCEVLKERGEYRELTQVCIKMTNEVRPHPLSRTAFGYIHHVHCIVHFCMCIKLYGHEVLWVDSLVWLLSVE